MKDSARYAKIVEWSEEDGCFVGSCPGLISGGCHGDDEVAVFQQLCAAVEEAIELYKLDGKPLPAATRVHGYANETSPPHSPESLPYGGLSLRKYAILTAALGMARGELYSAAQGDLQNVQKIVDLTSTRSLARALGCSEGELAIIWDDHLTASEMNRLKGFA